MMMMMINNYVFPAYGRDYDHDHDVIRQVFNGSINRGL